MFLTDFHVHTDYSDGRMKLADVVDMYGSLGFGAISITDHLCETGTWLGKASRYLNCSLTPESFPGYLEAVAAEAERAWQQYRMVVIPGFELTKNSISNSRSAHILALGVNKFLAADADVLDLARAVRAQGALAVAAHPVWTRKVEKQTYHLWSRRDELADEFDAWEVASGPFLFDEVAETNLPKLATSDLHVPRQMRAWKTVLDCERHPEAILQAIRRQELRFHFYNPPAEFDRWIATRSASSRLLAAPLEEDEYRAVI